VTSETLGYSREKINKLLKLKETNAMLLSLQPLSYLKAKYKVKIGNLSLHYLHISMSTSVSDRATKTTLNVERAWHDKLYHEIGQNTYPNCILFISQAQSSAKVKPNEIIP